MRWVMIDGYSSGHLSRDGSFWVGAKPSLSKRAWRYRYARAFLSCALVADLFRIRRSTTLEHAYYLAIFVRTSAFKQGQCIAYFAAVQYTVA